MAKKSKDQAESPKKLIQDKIAKHLLQEFQQLETLTGKKEFAKRLKKAAKIITQGLEFKEATKEDLAAATKPEADAAKKPAPAKPAAKKTAAPKKPAAKKVAKKPASPKAAMKKPARPAGGASPKKTKANAAA
ncbi:hypothetical protein U0035_01950 [Niabella yanshanensis]|uniref:Uncharacterized protein n=1 Tax=Niabella yanshanensis TaxID=577386 RepID=A0ABZ0WA00_9BACT|nr:histone [Niabella yanshanensis]WQD38906.1 hypothetical protein U0035_01950 [Niabella yanshanensis]